jgi:hypothetical protein
MSVYKANVDLSDLFHDMSYNYQKSFLVEEFCSLPIEHQVKVVGERVVLGIVVTETVTCAGCFFESKGACEVWRKYPCASKERSDHKNVIFKEVKE